MEDNECLNALEQTGAGQNWTSIYPPWNRHSKSKEKINTIGTDCLLTESSVRWVFLYGSTGAIISFYGWGDDEKHVRQWSCSFCAPKPFSRLSYLTSRNAPTRIKRIKNYGRSATCFLVARKCGFRGWCECSPGACWDASRWGVNAKT